MASVSGWSEPRFLVCSVRRASFLSTPFMNSLVFLWVGFSFGQGECVWLGELVVPWQVRLVFVQGHAQSRKCEIEADVAWKAPLIARSKQPIGGLDQRDLRLLRFHLSFCGLGSAEETVPSLGWSGPGMRALLARAAWWRRAMTLGRFPASWCAAVRLPRAVSVWG